MTESYNKDAVSKEDKLRDEKTDDYIFPQRSHWEKYQIYYLVFGFFFLFFIILISSSISNNQIRKINERLGGKKHHNFNFSSSKMADHFSRLEKEPFPKYVKEMVKEEIAKVEKSPLNGYEKEIREE